METKCDTAICSNHMLSHCLPYSFHLFGQQKLKPSQCLCIFHNSIKGRWHSVMAYVVKLNQVFSLDLILSFTVDKTNENFCSPTEMKAPFWKVSPPSHLKTLITLLYLRWSQLAAHFRSEPSSQCQPLFPQGTLTCRPAAGHNSHYVGDPESHRFKH